MSKLEKLGVVLLVAFAAVFSPLSSYIYFPALTAIASDLHTSLSRMNLTITSYMIVSDVAPTVLGSLADQSGRRPVYLLMFSVFVLANVGLALQTSYPAIVLLRMLQSAGGSATVGLGYGVVGDITESSERGAYMGILGCAPNTAPGLGPVIGGVLAYKAGWRWTFWFLAISGTLSLLLIATILPETARLRPPSPKSRHSAGVPEHSSLYISSGKSCRAAAATGRCWFWLVFYNHCIDNGMNGRCIGYHSKSLGRALEERERQSSRTSEGPR